MIYEQCLFENTKFHDPDTRVLQIFSPGNTNLEFKAKNVFNLPKLRRNQSIIIHTSPYFNSALGKFGLVFLHGEIELKCAEGYRFATHTNEPITKKKGLFNTLSSTASSVVIKRTHLKEMGYITKHSEIFNATFVRAVVCVPTDD